MFPTAHPPWQYQYQYVTPNPTISPPALHNARYAGWTRPPIQLPRVIDTLSRHPYEVTTAHTRSSNSSFIRALYAHLSPEPHATHPRTNARAQASADIMGPVDSRRCNVPHIWAWNGGARAQSLQFASEMGTTAQHDTEHAWLADNHSARRTTSLNIHDTQKVYLHPFLAPPSVSLIYDLRYPPASLRFPSSSPFAGCGCEFLHLPLTPERPRQIRLISRDFPWAFDIGPSAGEENVTCLDVIAMLHAALQCSLTDTEWGAVGDHKRASLMRACGRRLRIQPTLQGSSNFATRTGHTVNFAPGTDAQHHRPIRREPLLLRVDWLGSRVAFLGLVKDDEFARSRVIPGGGQPPETWVVKFQRLS